MSATRINPGMMSSDSQTWETPDDLFQALHEEFEFELDAAALPTNAKLPRFNAPPAHILALYDEEASLRSLAKSLKQDGAGSKAKGLLDEALKVHRALLAAQAEHLARVEWAKSTWLNSPYGDELPIWLRTCTEQARRGCTIAALVPLRPDPDWWIRYANAAHERREIRGRLHFKGGPAGAAPFGSAALVFRPDAPRGLRWPRRLVSIDKRGRNPKVIFGDAMEV